MKYPKLPPQLNKAIKLLPDDIEHIKAALPALSVRMGKNKAKDFLAVKFGVSRGSITYAVMTREQRLARNQQKYEARKRRGFNQNTPEKKEQRKLYSREKRARQREEIRDYFRPFNRDYKTRVFNAVRRNNSLESALKMIREDGIRKFNARYWKRPDFVKQVLQYEPLLQLLVEGKSMERIGDWVL